jgi:hypothetical protein
MALGRYVISSGVTVPAGTPSPVAGGLGILSWTAPGPYPVTYARGQAIMLDPAGPLYAAITAAGGTLRAFADTDATRAGASN